jgi:3-mercaptopyruvate sulfurtransferase SseA
MRPFVLMPWFLALASLVFSACVQAPTKVQENFQPQYDELVTKASKPVVITENTIILDARSSFDYGLFHVANSHWFPWENLAESRESGLLLTDLKKVQRRLGLNGLSLHTPVVIVGNGKFGGGSEGRLAWSLLYYGLYDVQVTSIEVFRKQMTSQPVAPAMNKDTDDLKPNTRLEILGSEFSALLKNPAELSEKKIRIIDVRSDMENLEHKEVLHLDWKKFYNSEGRPNPKVLSDLKQIGVAPGDRIILVSQNGVESGAAAYALMALGFANVQNFTAGWNSLR